MRELDAAVHDVRGALSVITGQCTLAQRSDPSVAKRLQLIEREVERVRKTLDRIGAPSEPAAEHVDIADICRAVVDANAAQAALRDRAIAVDVENDLLVSGEPERLRVAIENLVQNAVRHAPLFTSVLVRARRVGAEVWIDVSDAGRGIPASDRRRIFAPGERGSRPVGRGSGLGLTIARDAAQAHGGDLHLVDADTETTFRIRLPRFVAT